MPSTKWKLLGYDTFSEHDYPLNGEYDTEEEARLAATERLKELEDLQPSEQSGGQGKFGIQDRVYVIRPDGTKYQFLPGDPVQV